jgi:hypothetical protein
VIAADNNNFAAVIEVTGLHDGFDGDRYFAGIAKFHCSVGLLHEKTGEVVDCRTVLDRTGSNVECAAVVGAEQLFVEDDCVGEVVEGCGLCADGLLVGTVSQHRVQFAFDSPNEYLIGFGFRSIMRLFFDYHTVQCPFLYVF